MPDTIKVFSANFPPNTNCKAPVAINVAQFLSDCAPVAELTVTNDAPLGDTSLNVAGNYDIGDYWIHFSATDPCGNTGVDSFLLQVIDNSVPTAICNGSVVVALGSNGVATIQPDDIDLGSIDNCDIDTLTLSVSTFDCSQLGNNAVTLTVIDIHGNSNTCTVNVAVELGPTAGFTLTTSGSTVSFFGAADGTASATAAGGSGTFLYSWSNGDNTSMISGLTAGQYLVTVVDQMTGCQKIDTVQVLDGDKLTLIVGDAAGAQGAIVSVPVTVEQFLDIIAFSFSVQVDLPSVGTILGISSINPMIAPTLVDNISAGVLSVIYADPNQTPKTLPDGTVLFNIDVELSDVAPVGSMSPATVVGSPVMVEFFQSQQGNPVTIMINVDNGSVSINGVANDLTIAGNIKTWINPEVPTSVEKPVQNVTVNLSGGVGATTTTGVPGAYTFNVPNGVNTNTTCFKSTAGNAGITAGDLLRIVNHIFGDTMPSPYQWVAADVNNSKTVSLGDYLLIQRVVLGTDQNLMNQLDWKFVPKSYVFPSNNTPMFGPLTNIPPNFIDHNPATMDFLNDDFVAVRMGDVNGNTPVNFNSDANDRYGNNDALYFGIDNRNVNSGEILEVPFKASDFNNRHAYQMTIAFDKNVLELEDVVMGSLPNLSDENFGMAHLDEGYLTSVWVNRDPVSLRDDEVMFTLRFRAIRSSKQLSDVLQPGSQITRAEAYTTGGSTQRIEFRYGQSQAHDIAPFVLYQNMPNPFQNVTTIAFRLPEAGRSTLRVFNMSGQLVKTVVGEFGKGYNEISLRKDDLGTPGVYWYELESPTHSDRKKMILID
ncbi:MAG: T9SS type A sorting domain-containing protein [Lewinellaceae bacterium]|nr:T9SS type A sorting domain-containing protein [Lewinellaceae bacterium]